MSEHAQRRDPPIVGYLGPVGTFTEQALFTQSDLCGGELVQMGSMGEVLRATDRGDVDYGFVAIENAIEGTVNVTLDTLAFDLDLSIQREVVLAIQMNLMVIPGSRIDEIKTITSISVATAQCRTWLDEHLPGIPAEATNSTADAARLVSESGDPATAAIAPARAAEVYGLEILAPHIEDHPENQTRFLVVSQSGIPAPTGHDKTSIVVQQRDDRPGSLIGILQEFATRNINLSTLVSRPTKTRLGDYAFIIDLHGHVADEVVGDALRDIQMKHGDVKILGSYPALGESDGSGGNTAQAWTDADNWLSSVRNQIH
ncbi:MAG: prephenate dehydratase [Acidimicrobiales bacterium]